VIQGVFMNSLKSYIEQYLQYWYNIKLNYPKLFDEYKLIFILILISFGLLIFGIVTWLGPVGQYLGGIGLLLGAWIAYKRLIEDVKKTALMLDINSEIITNINKLVVIAVNIKLKNSGAKRINARMYTEVDRKRGCLFVSEGVDVCCYAGTLKIRRVPDFYNDVKLIDWYFLERITDQLIIKDWKACLGNFEQINYLDEFGLEGSDRDVNFFIEANEQYNQQVVVMLPPGLYAIKAFFLGEYRAGKHEEYWSCTKIIKI